MKWPTFADAKQSEAACSNIFFQRCSKYSIGRDDETWRLLLTGKSCAWIGLPGIGKTTAINGLFLRSIQSLGADNGFDRVIFRISSTIYDIRICAGHIEISTALAFTLREAEEYMNGVYDENEDSLSKKKIVAFLELKEAESDPTCFLPTLVTTSSRQVFSSSLKTMEKKGIYFFVIDPWSKEEIQAMIETLLMFGGTSANFLRECWELRYAEVGGIPRIVTADPIRYSGYLNQM